MNLIKPTLLESTMVIVAYFILCFLAYHYPSIEGE